MSFVECTSHTMTLVNFFLFDKRKSCLEPAVDDHFPLVVCQDIAECALPHEQVENLPVYLIYL